MKDEYDCSDINGEGLEKIVTVPSFTLENGTILENINLKYTSYGKFTTKSRFVVVCHALTGNSAVKSWWSSLFQSEANPNGVFSSSYFVICINLLGSPNNPTNPSLLTWNDFENSFYNNITVRDQAKIQLSILEQEFSIQNIQMVIGGSLGGMVAQEIMKQSLSIGIKIENLVLACCGSFVHSWQVAFSEVQRNCIKYSTNKQNGLKLARQVALLSYRTHGSYDEKFCGKSIQIEEYFEYCSNKFLQRFNVFSYLSLLKTMDSFTQELSKPCSLAKFKGNVLVISVDSDILYPPSEQVQLVKQFNAECVQHSIIKSIHGHDGFLLEQETVNEVVLNFLRDRKQQNCG